MSIAGTVAHINEENVAELSNLVRAAAKRISANLAGPCVDSSDHRLSQVSKEQLSIRLRS
jgi:hypothetical protein